MLWMWTKYTHIEGLGYEFLQDSPLSDELLCICVSVLSHASHVWLFMTLWTIAHQATDHGFFQARRGGASLVALAIKNPPANAGDRLGFNPWVGKMPWRKGWQPTPVLLLGGPMDRGAWWATVCRVTQSWTWLKRVSTHTGMGEE